MTRPCSSIWLSSHNDIQTRLKCTIDLIRNRKSSKGSGRIFFRADDIAVPSNNLSRLINLFSDYKVPLALAIVPAWLTKSRWLTIRTLIQKNPSLWCLHQHGWRHINYEKRNKKQEFGLSRTNSQKKADIIKGRRHLESLLGKEFCPIFTPPWNRCDQYTLMTLKNLGYYAVSRMDEKLSKNDVLPDFSVNLDLHSRKERNSLKSMDILLKEMVSCLSKALCGIMIHHQRMNNTAFSFLEALIIGLLEVDGIKIVNLKDLVDNHSN